MFACDLTPPFRIDYTEFGTYQFNEWTAPVCQDSWIFQSPLDDKLVEQSDFYFGWRGCDNHVAWLFREFNYHILNPCLKIICRLTISFSFFLAHPSFRHLHATQKRNQKESDQVVGEYIPVPPNADL